MMRIRLQAYTFVALRPVLARCTATYACVDPTALAGHPRAAKLRVRGGGNGIHLEDEYA